MLARSETEIVRRDQIVPNLDILFDPDSFVRALGTSWPGALNAKAEITYIRYKSRKSCVVSYRLISSSETCALYAKAHPDGIDFPSQQTEGRFILEKGRIVVSLFPEDKQLRVISELWNAKQRTKLLSMYLPQVDFSKVELRVLNYLPERRFVCCLSAPNNQVLIKAYDEKGMRTAAASHIRSTPRLRIANKLADSLENRFSIYEWLPGSLLTAEILRKNFNTQRLELVGEALAELHQQKPEVPILKREEETETLAALTEHLAFLNPALTDRLDSVSNDMSRILLSFPDCAGAIHGDFSAKQVLLDSETVGFIDFDRSARGDPALDIGNFLAYLERDALYARFDLERIAVFREAILSGYKKLSPPPESRRIDFYAAVCLYRLLPDPFRYHEKQWPQRMEAILCRVEQLHSGVAATGASL